MKKLLVIFLVVGIFSCATPPMKPADVQSKLVVGMSVADVMATLGIPDEKRPLDGGKFQLAYNGYLLDFVDEKLNAARMSSDAADSDLALKSFEEMNPGYKADSIVLNKDAKPLASPFQMRAPSLRHGDWH